MPGLVGKFRDANTGQHHGRYFVLHYPPDTVELTVMDKHREHCLKIPILRATTHLFHARFLPEYTSS
jgi:hypothetical protein